jgi:hypothetical protein
MEIPIVVEANEVNVAGFVTSIDLETDIGPQGNRGAIIFSGAATPTASPSTTPLSSVYGTVNQFQSGDLYIKTANPNYGWTYIFQDQPSGGVWTPIVPMSITGAGNTIYTGAHAASFTAGEATVSINMMDILGRDTDLPTANSFVVVATPQVNSSSTYLVSVKTVTVTVGATLDIVFNGQKISNVGAISLLNSESIGVNLSIGVVS